ncbi:MULTISPECIES: TetR/AcrR family transcriptional regulator [Burkholderia]|uniref:TetR/AcrR family transcriptional regulator n=1 Tax=Burkholderia TaxID=32008 RepID=UPI000052DBE1|nr:MULTISPECIES: TetR/AcrR family transcriptional regulator [Burkholderia]ABK13590.1 transcriptional regulator, TetR family [Burkholderia cenocepacia HI2424]MCF1371775.1 TetR/AcrR family transcriptional regulator [Burkholderia cenocepacia]MCF1389154.1 TetR/AcrR family transcriptional regulator [Burkholderia cenocepacia]MCG0578283.1 TetR/AcrR family transcriptional regulator [Burkholderia cenocepacia]MCW3641118.1 TetR/AcrR family transcriptional regulator [Burkholderia cenocepacia]
MAIGTRDALVHAAEGLMRTRGYAAFSYADLAEAVGIKKASIHHHFPTKEDLGIAIVEEYVTRVRGEFERIELEYPDAKGRLGAFFLAFRASSDGGLLPLCGALAAEMAALPSGLQQLTHRFFELQLHWLTAILDEGVANGEIPPGASTRKKAFLLLSVLEGASFINWATKENDSFDDDIIRLIVEEI